MESTTEKLKRDKYASSLAAERAADILLMLASCESASLGEIAAAVGASGGATHRVVTALMHKGLLAQHARTERYSLSWSSLALARARGGAQDIRHLCLPYMTALRDQSGETVTLSVRRGHQLVCIEQVDSRAELRWVGEIGRVEVLYAGAAAKMLLAGMSARDLEDYLAKVDLQPLTPKTIIDRNRLLHEVARIREAGIATGLGERVEGIFGLASPILQVGGEMMAVMSLGAPASRMTPERVADCRDMLLSVTDRISADLGFSEGTGRINKIILQEHNQ